MEQLNASYQLVVIGGGINGVSIARDAVLRGLSVLLLEKAPTLAAGASSASSKLAHGGLRYLEHFQFRLVKESLQERNLLLELSPDIVKPLPFILPVYKWSKHSYLKLRLGLKLYDFLASPSPMPEHVGLAPEEFIERYPDFRHDGLTGALKYYDAQMHDRELVFRNANSATVHGAKILTSISNIEFITQDDTITGIQFKDSKQQTQLVHCDQVVNVTGAWSNIIRQSADPFAAPIVQASKGVHLICNKLPFDEAFTLETPQDKRTFFIMPYQGQTLIGTTDTPYSGDLNHVIATQEDIDYLVAAAQFYVKSFKKSDILDTFAGLRPLIAQSASSMSSVSRELTLKRIVQGSLVWLAASIQHTEKWPNNV